MPITKTVFCTLQVAGLHCWADCPLPEVQYLRDPHRHVFHITAHVRVSHNDRDVEFIVLKGAIEQYLRTKYFNEYAKLHDFGGQSCEMIAAELIDAFDLCQCEVNEDGENGSILYNTAE